MIETIARVLRGGSWNYTSHLLRAAICGGIQPTSQSGIFGFRLVVRIKGE